MEGMVGIIITPDKILDCYWDHKDKKFKKKIIGPEILPVHLWKIVTLDRVTLERLLAIVESNIDMWETILCQDIKPFLQESKLPPTEDIKQLKHLEISWDAEINIVDGCRDLMFAPALMGLMEDPTTSEQIDMGIEFTPVNNLTKYRVQLRPQVEVVVIDYDGFEQTGQWQQPDNITLGERSFSVIEVFKAVFDEIAFWGSPPEREKWFGIIKQRIQEVRQEARDEGIEIPWEDAKKTIDRETEQKRDTLNLLGEDDDTN